MYAKYTVVLAELLNNEHSKKQIDNALSTYPIYTPANVSMLTIIPSREEINTKLLNHYKYREIGFETVGRFIDELEISMNEIMPYYNQLFKSEDIINGIDDIFGNLDVTEEYSETVKGSAKGDSETSGTGSTESQMQNNNQTDSEQTTSATDYGKHVKSETPQKNLNVTAREIDSIGYADSVNWDKAENNGTSSGKTTSNDTSTSNSTSSQTSSGTSSTESESETKHTLHRKGNQGVNTYAHDMLEFRELFLNIVQQIIEDKRIKELFMNVY